MDDQRLDEVLARMGLAMSHADMVMVRIISGTWKKRSYRNGEIRGA